MTSYNNGDMSDPCVWCPNGWCIGDPEHEQTQCESSYHLVNQKLPEVISDCMKPADPNVDIEDMYPALQCADVKKYAIGRCSEPACLSSPHFCTYLFHFMYHNIPNRFLLPVYKYLRSVFLNNNKALEIHFRSETLPMHTSCY